MVERPPFGIDRLAAITGVEGVLIGKLGAIELSSTDLLRYQGHPTNGWRLGFVADGQQILIDVVINQAFPFSKPDVFWIDAPAFPSIPHVEPSGRVCVMPATMSINPLEPVKVVCMLLAKVEDIIVRGLRGENTNDFCTEFRSYWNEVATGREVVSIVDPCEPSRVVWGWPGRKLIVVAEDKSILRHWLRNAIGKKNVTGASLIQVPLIWLAQPLLPSEYPLSEDALAKIVASAGTEALRIYERTISDELEASLVLLGAKTLSGGSCFGAVTLARRASSFSRTKRRVGGFRERVPRQLMRFSRRQDSVTLSPVARADPWWIHGRDTQDDLETLLAATVVVIGCGSLGSPVARLLAAAGVGKLILLDPETMTFANAGRHILGVDSVAKPKSRALRDQLAREFPHLTIEYKDASWEEVAREEPELFKESDLLISTMGDWQAESALNAFQISKRGVPPVIYAWAEPHAAGGHAVLIGPGAGCFACGLSCFGGARFQIAAFEDETLQREPACGAFFQPYGASDIMGVGALATSLAIATLYERSTAGEHHMIGKSPDAVAISGGKVTRDWMGLVGTDPGRGHTVVRQWSVRSDCSYCGGRGF